MAGNIRSRLCNLKDKPKGLYNLDYILCINLIRLCFSLTQKYEDR